MFTAQPNRFIYDHKLHIKCETCDHSCISSLIQASTKLINIFITLYFYVTSHVANHRSFNLADDVALETEQPSNAVDEGAVRVVQPTDGDRHLWEAVRDRNGTK